MAKSGLEGRGPAVAVTVSYPQHAWPMDGPGTDRSMPAATLAEMPQDGETPQRQAAQTPRPLRAAPRQPDAQAKAAPVAAPTPLTPTPLTKSMIATPAPRQPTAKQAQASQAPASAAPSPSAPARLAPPRPLGPQTARADTGGTSDTDMSDTAMSSTGNGDAITWTVPREAVKDAPSATATAPAQPPRQASQQAAVAVPGGGYAVQFASYTSEDRAWRGWDTLRVEASDLLSGVEPKVERADLGGDTGVVYRLRTAPAAKANADTLCAALKGQGINCLVVKAEPKMAAIRHGGDPAAS